jgi:serine/threonine protein kinase
MHSSRDFFPSLGKSPSTQKKSPPQTERKPLRNTGLPEIKQIKGEEEPVVESARVYLHQPGLTFKADDVSIGQLFDTYRYYLAPFDGREPDQQSVEALYDIHANKFGYISSLERGKHVVQVPQGSYTRCEYVFNVEADIEVGDVFDPTVITPLNAPLIDAVFKATLNHGFVEAGPILFRNKRNDGSTVYVIRELTYSLYAVSKVVGIEPDKAYVIGGELGKGVFGIVHDKKGTLKRKIFSRDISYIDNNGSKATKLVYNHDSDGHGRNYDSDDVQRECRMMRKLGYFGYVRHSEAKIKSKKAGVVTLRKFSGRELLEVLDEDRYKRLGKRYDSSDKKLKGKVDDFKKLTNEDRYLLSIALLKALKIVHARDVKHLDVKPQNILVEKTGGNWHARIVDAGLSECVGVGVEARGTPLYVAPEFVGSMTRQSDIYSLGRVLGIVWGDEEFFIWMDSASMSMADFLDQVINNKDRKLQLFSKVDMSSQEAKMVNEVVYGMLEHNPNDRLDLDVAIIRMQMAYELYLIAQDGLSEEDKKAIFIAGGYARAMDTVFRDHYGKELNDNVLKEMRGWLEHINFSRPEQFAQAKLAQKLFKKILGFKCLDLDSIDCISAIKARVRFILDRFTVSTKTLREQIAELQDLVIEHGDRDDEDYADLQSLLFGCDVIKQKVMDCQPDLDEMLQVAEHAERKTMKIKAAIEEYKELVRSSQSTLLNK